MTENRVSRSQRDGRIPVQGKLAIRNPERVAMEIVFTGERADDHFQVYLNGVTVELTHCAMKAFVSLVVARVATNTGFVRIPKLTVSRLRRCLDKVAGEGAGKHLIETGCREEYRLKPVPEQMANHISFEPSFFELEEMRVFSNQHAQVIRKTFRIAHPS